MFISLMRHLLLALVKPYNPYTSAVNATDSLLLPKSSGRARPSNGPSKSNRRQRRAGGIYAPTTAAAAKCSKRLSVALTANV